MSTEMLHERFEIEGPRNTTIYGDVRLPAGSENSLPVIVVCHGFKGFKDWGFHPYLGEQLAARGFCVVHFNFSHNGHGADLHECSELELFSANTFSLEIDDVQRVISAVKSGSLPFADKIDPSCLGIAGHSRGGIATVHGAADANIRGAVTLAAVGHLPPVDAESEKQWRAEGVHYIMNARTNQKLPLGLDLLEEILAGDQLIENAVRTLDIPMLVVHGDADESVAVSHAHDIASWSKNAQLEILSGASHTFGAVHPFQGSTADLDTVIQLTSDFFEKVLL